MKTVRSLTILRKILLLFILCIFGPFLTLWLIEILKLEGTLGWHLAALLAFFALTLFYVLARRLPLSKLVKPVSFGFFLFAVIIETPILVFAPANSFVPTGILEASNWMQDVTKGPCNFQSLIAEADDFYRGAVDFSGVRIVRGGLSKYPWFGRATVNEETIYVGKCLELEVFIHESAHIWQHQNGIGWLGPRTAWGAAKLLLWRVIDPTGTAVSELYFVYDHGGPVGLPGARAGGKSFIEFGIEQQAMIIQDYHRVAEGYLFDYHGRYFTSDYIEDLEFFAQQVLGER